jgi:cytochrome b6-f complex iron-sulfur subunit
MTSPKVPEPQESAAVSRNTFLKLLLGFSFTSTIAGVLIPIIGYLLPPETSGSSDGGRTLVGTTIDIPFGQGKVVPVGSKPVVVVNTEQGIKAYSAICTHLGCVCLWDSTRQIILCPCHDGQFSPINGSVISGPPPTALPSLDVQVEGEEIFVMEKA